ncbi:MAG: alpha/beta fold hydrolase, partial [Pseudomonas sp.]
MSLTRSRWLPGLLLTAALPVIAHAKSPEYGPQLQGFEYPYT